MNAVDRYFGVHAAGLEARARRLDLLASNIANAATPNYKARDVDFATMLRAAGGATLATTSPRQIAEPANSPAARPGYRVPVQASLDGNTVELATEQTLFGENAVRYQASLSFINGQIGQLMDSLKSN